MKKQFARVIILFTALSGFQVNAQQNDPLAPLMESRSSQGKALIPAKETISYKRPVQESVASNGSFSVHKKLNVNTAAIGTESVFANASAQQLANTYLELCAPEMKMANPSSQFQVIGTQLERGQQTHIRLQQKYKGLTVYGTEVLVHGSGNELQSMHGQYVNHIELDINPKLSSATALTICTSDLSEKTEIRELTASEQSILKYSKPVSELLIYRNPLNNIAPTLAWHVMIRPNLLEQWDYFMDAGTGKILNRYNHTCAADGPKTTIAADINTINRTINTYQVGSTYYLIDASKSMFNPGSLMPDKPEGAIWTMDAQNTAVVSLAQVTSTNNTTWSSKAVSAHFNASTVYDYFKNTHGQISINNNGGNILSVVNVTNADGQPMDNLLWNGEMLLYGNGNTSFRPLVGSLDLAAHEFTHGVIQSSANLEYQGQSGAISESMADIFGCMLDKSDWLMGEDVVKSGVFPSGALRNLQDPHNGTTQGNAGWQPSNMSEYYTGTNDNGGVHLNSGILNKAFYTLATNITSAKAEKIYYRALTVYLTRYSQFSDLRYAVFEAATDLFAGASSAEALAVKAAFDGVGIYDNGTGVNYGVDLPLTSGVETILSYDPNYFNSFRLVNTKTDGSNPTFVTMSTAKRRPSVTDDGSVCVFVDTSGRIHKLNLVGPLNETILFPTDHFYANVAISKDGSKLATVTNSIDTSIFIYDFTSNNWFQFKLYNATFTQGQNSPGILYASSLEWDYKGENLLIDSKYKLGDSSTFWDISTINVWNTQTNSTGSGRIDKLVSQSSTDISLLNPSFAKNSPYIITYDMYNKRQNTYNIMCKNLITGRTGLITNNNTLGFPTYSRLDDKILFTTVDVTIQDTGIQFVGLNTNKIEAITAPILLIPHLKWANWYTQGQRALTSGDKKILNFKLSTLNPPASGIVIGDSVLVKVGELDVLTALTADYITSAYCKAEIGSTLQISGYTKNNFTSPVIYRITAQDNSSKIYTIITQKPSATKLITAFSFQDLSPVVNGVIANDTIVLKVPNNTDVTLLTATFTASAFAKVTVNGKLQVSGTTVNDYFHPVTYKVTAYDSTVHNYTVIVKFETGLGETGATHHLSFYPNPSDNKIYFDLNGVAHYEIFNIAGELVGKGTSQNQPIEVAKLPEGLYMIRLTNKGLTYTGKFIRN